jgi:hypothetical protein
LFDDDVAFSRVQSLSELIVLAAAVRISLLLWTYAETLPWA